MSKNSKRFSQEYKLYFRDFIFFLITCIVSITIAELVLFKDQQGGLNVTTRLFTYAYLIIPLTLVVMVLSYSYRTQRIKKTGVIRSSIRYKLIIAFIFVSILPSIPIVLLSGDLITKSIDSFFSIDINRGLQAGNNIANFHISKEKNTFLTRLKNLNPFPANFKTLQNYFTEKNLLLESEYFAVVVKNKIKKENIKLLKKHLKRIDFQKIDKNIFEAEFGSKEAEYKLFKIKWFNPKNIIIGKIFGDKLISDIQTLKRTNKAYKKAVYFREKVSIASQFGLILTSIILVLAAVIVSFYLARQISEPLLRLAFASKSISQGEYEQKIDFDAKGEMGVLIESFNQMIISIKNYKDQIKHSQRLSIWKEVAQRVAHEIKNPLTPIQLNAERLKRKISNLNDTELGEFVDKSVKVIIQEVDIIKRLVNEFSQFARMPNPKMALNNLNDTFRDAARMYLDKKGVQIIINYDDTMPRMKFDRELLIQVFTNLLKNSIEAVVSRKKDYESLKSEEKDKSETEKDIKSDPIIEINFLTKKLLGENYYYFTIEDNGPPLDDDIKDKIFEPYFSTKKEGTGIGLAISEKIILDHNATITVSNSDKYSGLKFEICFKENEA
jgi:nitrogen fixation/metabolism regulation signal transduction histidine kinase